MGTCKQPGGNSKERWDFSPALEVGGWLCPCWVTNSKPPPRVSLYIFKIFFKILFLRCYFSKIERNTVSEGCWSFYLRGLWPVFTFIL